MRSSFVDRENDANALFAAATAARVSSSSPSVTRPMTSPVVGFVVSSSSVPCEDTKRPPMECCVMRLMEQSFP
jgi:hypothetical protein